MALLLQIRSQPLSRGCGETRLCTLGTVRGRETLRGLASSKQLKPGSPCDKLERKTSSCRRENWFVVGCIERNYSANISRDWFFHSWFLPSRSLQWHYVAIVIELKLIENWNWLANDFRLDSFYLRVSCHKLILLVKIVCLFYLRISDCVLTYSTRWTFDYMLILFANVQLCIYLFYSWTI